MQIPDEQRHFGLVVDDRSRARDAGAIMLEGPGLNFLDPWGNYNQVVEYRDVQFAKTDAVLKAMKLKLEKNEKTKAEPWAKHIKV